MNLKYNSWDKITFSVWNKIEKLNDLEDDFEKNVALLAILADVDEDTLLSLPLPQFAKLMAETEFIQKMPNATIKEEYVVNGNKYVVKINPQHFTVNQWVDYSTLSANMKENKVRVLATVILPKGKEYGNYDIEEVVKDINDMPITDIFAINAFFLLSYRALLVGTLTFSVKKMKKIMKMKKLNEEQKMKIQQKITEMQQLINSYK